MKDLWPDRRDAPVGEPKKELGITEKTNLSAQLFPVRSQCSSSHRGGGGKSSARPRRCTCGLTAATPLLGGGEPKTEVPSQTISLFMANPFKGLIMHN
jgi:hypothetical protein